jgi:acetate---CoA ligase (ADP-forming)
MDALFRQSGVIRTETLGELLDVASLLASQPVPRGNRVAVLTNSGEPGIMCADACAPGRGVSQTLYPNAASGVNTTTAASSRSGSVVASTTAR